MPRGKVYQENCDKVNFWLQDLVKSQQCASNTYITYKHQVHKFLDWLDAKYNELELKAVEKKMIKEYHTFMVEKPASANTIKTAIKAMRNLFNWMEEANIIDRTPFPSKLQTKTLTLSVPVLPAYKDIMLMRNAINTHIPQGQGRPSLSAKPNMELALRRATIYECLLSLGLRISELHHLRVSDFNFAARVKDREEDRYSRFTGGSVYVNPRVISIKRGNDKTPHFSMLAGRLLKLHIEVHGLSGNLPVFPWAVRSMQRWIEEIGEGIIEQNVLFKQEKRDEFFRDVDLSNVEISEETAKVIAQHQEYGNKKEKQDLLFKQSQKVLEQKKRKMHPHALRHFNGCLLYYRDWAGGRHNFLYVRDLLGHTNQTTTLGYITKANLIQDDTEWRKLMLGDAKTYWRIFGFYERLNKQA